MRGWAAASKADISWYWSDVLSTNVSNVSNVSWVLINVRITRMIHISGLGTISPHPAHALVTQTHLHHDCVTLQHLLLAIAFFLFMNRTDIIGKKLYFYFCSNETVTSLPEPGQSRIAVPLDNWWGCEGYWLGRHCSAHVTCRMSHVILSWPAQCTVGMFGMDLFLTSVLKYYRGKWLGWLLHQQNCPASKPHTS